MRNISLVPDSRVSPATRTLAPRDAALIQQWRVWAQEQTAQPSDSDRAQAVQRVIASCERRVEQGNGLSLSGLDISGTLPPLPHHLHFVDLSSTAGLAALSPFPDDCQLRELTLSENEGLTALPPIPPSLRVLNALNCDLPFLPPFPENSQLSRLRLDENPRIVTLPPLPPSLQQLTANMCSITHLPSFPHGSQLDRLELMENPIQQLPLLPPRLYILNVNECQLTALPGMPDSLRLADFSDNHIHDLSQQAPYAIEDLDLSRNPITGLPEWVFQLNPEAEIHLSAVQMSDPLRRAITDQAGAARSAGVGPRIIFDMQQGEDRHQPVRPLEVAAAAWVDETAHAQAQQQTWLPFSNEGGAQPFSHFLDRLALTTNHTDAATREPFRQGVRQLLADMARSPPLREDCFAICVDATASCEDRVTLSYQQMAVPRLAEAVRRGDFDANEALPGFIEQARSLYRREVLTDIANRKVAGMNVVDPIEVHLAYQVQLNEPLDLRLDAEQMRFYEASGVTDEDLQVAETEVRQRENQGFVNHLINHSGPWGLLMHKRAPDLHTQMLEAKHQALEHLPQALDARLAQHGLQNDADAVREAGRAVTDELTLHAQRPVVEQFLREHANDPNALLAPRWSPPLQR